MTREAPAGGAVVALASSVVDVARTPPSVTVPAGSTSATFALNSPTIGRTMTTVISATYEGVTRAATLTVGPPALEANFTVVWKAPPRGQCAILSSSGNVNCELYAGASRGFPKFYVWTFRHAGKDLKFTMTNDATLRPAMTCDFLDGGKLSFGVIIVAVELRVEDEQGNTSPPLVQPMEVYPFGTGSNIGYCGYVS